MKDNTVKYTVNGSDRHYDGPPMARLLDVLREELDLTGTKEGCGEGECGACTVWLDNDIVCACLVPMFQLTGREVKTIEALASGNDLAPIQQAFVDEGGVQCGACTPGMIVAAQALLNRSPEPSREDMADALAGNLCRCTGYEGIFRAIVTAVAAQRPQE